MTLLHKIITEMPIRDLMNFRDFRVDENFIPVLKERLDCMQHALSCLGPDAGERGAHAEEEVRLLQAIHDFITPPAITNRKQHTETMKTINLTKANSLHLVAITRDDKTKYRAMAVSPNWDWSEWACQQSERTGCQEQFQVISGPHGLEDIQEMIQERNERDYYNQLEDQRIQQEIADHEDYERQVANPDPEAHASCKVNETTLVVTSCRVSYIFAITRAELLSKPMFNGDDHQSPRMEWVFAIMQDSMQQAIDSEVLWNAVWWAVKDL